MKKIQNTKNIEQEYGNPKLKSKFLLRGKEVNIASI